MRLAHYDAQLCVIAAVIKNDDIGVLPLTQKLQQQDILVALNISTRTVILHIKTFIFRCPVEVMG